MFISRGLSKIGTASVILIVVLLISSARSWAVGSVFQDTREPRQLELTIGKSIILRSSEPVKRVAIAAPEIADFTLLSPHEVHIIGKAAGATNITLWQAKKASIVYDLDVAYDISRLKQKLHDILPLEKDVRVIATHDSITLSGTISSTANLSQALALAGAFAPKDKVVNLLQVAGVHQVMLEVKITEMSRSLIRRLGVNFAYVRGGDFGVSLLGGLAQVVEAADANLTSGPLNFLVSPAVNALFRFHKGTATWTGFIDALKQDGLVKVMAEPTLIALSGQTADFLAGGEFPIPVPNEDGITIEYKKFGVGLSFTPIVLSENKIRITVTPEVSEIVSSTVSLAGYNVPGITTRRASTMVELADGQSFAIAGLLKETIRETISKIPILGDIPILGALFRSQSFQKDETELIIVVTPHLVKPLNMAKQTFPTDYYIEPSGTEFYLWGLMEGRAKQSSDTRGALEGDFGHAMPITEMPVTE